MTTDTPTPDAFDKVRDRLRAESVGGASPGDTFDLERAKLWTAHRLDTDERTLRQLIDAGEPIQYADGWEVWQEIAGFLRHVPGSRDSHYEVVRLLRERGKEWMTGMHGPRYVPADWCVARAVQRVERDLEVYDDPIVGNVIEGMLTDEERQKYAALVEEVTAEG